MAMPESQELTCQEFVELVTEYLEGTLAPASRARFDEHLAVCPFCQIYLDQMRETIRTLGHLPADAMSAEALGVLMGHFRRWKLDSR